MSVDPNNTPKIEPAKTNQPAAIEPVKTTPEVAKPAKPQGESKVEQGTGNNK